jgi:hypothetical protein
MSRVAWVLKCERTGIDRFSIEKRPFLQRVQGPERRPEGCRYHRKASASWRLPGLAATTISAESCPMACRNLYPSWAWEQERLASAMGCKTGRLSNLSDA